MKIEVHVLAFNEAEMMPWTMRYYAQFCSRMVVHDLGSTDGTQEIAKKAGAEIVQHDCGGQFNDLQNKKIRNECWLGTTADWVIGVDCDEFVYFGAGVEATLASYDAQGIAIPKPMGYEMTSEVFPVGDGQITDYVKHGGLDAAWYSKPGLLSPKRVASTDFGTGAHMVNAVLHGGRTLTVDPRTPYSSPAVKLLHFHHIGPVEKIGAKYEAVIARLSPENRAHKWGVQADGMAHSREKRAMIISRLERVLA